MDLTTDQLQKLQALGISTSPKTISKTSINDANCVIIDQKSDEFSPSLATTVTDPSLSSHKDRLLKSNLTVIPLLSISGLTLVSFAGLILLKNSSSDTAVVPTSDTQFSPAISADNPTPTQVPKSIQHYLLSSQQSFTNALQEQSQLASASPTGQSNNSKVVAHLNQSLVSATDAIKNFPNDYRGYQQRGKIYAALLDSQPALVSQALSDLTTAFSLNSSSAEIARDLAALYSRTGNAQKTIEYLNHTVALEPTKPQNFYDLAKLQQQAGLIPQAVQTYTQLLTLVSDPNQKSQLQTEKQALENLVAQSGQKLDQIPTTPLPSTSADSKPSLNLDSPLLQASNSAGLTIAAPEETKDIKVADQTDSNAQAGTATLPSGQKDITITNTNITSASQIYLTIVSGGKNQTLKVVSKTNGSFTAGFDSALNEAVTFKWWIIKE